MMPQSEDGASFNFWNGSDVWNSLIPNDFDRPDSWSVSATKSRASLTNFDSTINTSKNSDNPVDCKTIDPNIQIPSWTPVVSVLRDVDIPSIWSTSDLYSSNDQNLSLSGPNLGWPPLSHCASEEPLVSNTSSELWTSGHFFDVSRESDTWKCEQTLLKNSDQMFSATGVGPTLLTLDSDKSTKYTFPDFPLVCAKVSSTGNGSSLNPGASAEKSASATFSTEQVYDHLINSHEGWGRRPVDQSTPWDISDLSKSTDNRERSGITTPTPNRSSFPVSPRNSLQVPTLESNVWTSEPPTGTNIWEMHYESCGSRNIHWNDSASVQNTCTVASTVCRPPNSFTILDSDPIIRNACHPSTTSRPIRQWDLNEKHWNSGAIPSGRPLLGGSRGSQNCGLPDDLPTWSNGVPSTSGGNTGSWDALSGNANVSQWNSVVSTGNSVTPSLFLNNADEVRRNQSLINPSNAQLCGERMLVHPFSNTYRADLVKYLMNQGFKKEDVQTALIDCNMDPERALQDLRERYSVCPPSFSNFSTGFNQLNTPSAFQATNPASMMQSRHKFSGSSNSAGHLLPGASPNPQIIRQQLTQQVRSALSLSLPNTAGGTGIGTPHPLLGGGSGNSLLGQPPPPLLNGSLLNSANGTILPSSITGTGMLTMQNKQVANPSASGRCASHASLVGTKRSDRQLSIIAAMQDLHKKHQSIQQQLYVYRNNPTMCSQPQYADVFAELQSQMQQIETQLRAKQTQLNIAYNQDSANATRGQTMSFIPDVTSNGQSTQSASNRTSQDHLVQQLMDLRVRPGNNSSCTEVENDFPTIGTWTAQSKSASDNQDKLMGIHETSIPRCLPNMKSSNMRNLAAVNGSWQSGGTRSLQSWQPNNLVSRHLPDSSCPLPSDPSMATGFVDQQLTQNTGQWLLVHSFVGGFSANLNVLHNLLSQYGLTYFHVLNSTSGGGNNTGSVLARLQSPELALQFIRAVGDRLSVEPITDSDALVQLQYRSSQCMNPRSESIASPFHNSISETTVNAFGVTSPNWINMDHFAGSTNSYATKKPLHSAGCLGSIMVSGIH